MNADNLLHATLQATRAFAARIASAYPTQLLHNIAREGMTPQDLMTKSQRALTSPRTLLQEGDNDGACNRAYYAMFDAARAALIAFQAPVPAEIAKTCSGLISAFSLHLDKPGRFPVALGKSLNQVEDLRLIADYKGDPIEIEDAECAVGQSQLFIAQVESSFLN